MNSSIFALVLTDRAAFFMPPCAHQSELQRQERDLNLKLLALKDELSQAENAMGTTIAKARWPTWT